MTLLTATLLLSANAVSAAQGTDTLPPGWYRQGMASAAPYPIRLDYRVKRSGRTSLRIQSAVGPEKFAIAAQAFKADSFRGRRLRLTGYVRAADVQGGASLWMRVDGPATDSMPFDNMWNRSVTGTAEWRRCEIVLNIPPTARRIVFGALLHGTGTLWADDLEFTVVDGSVPTTEMTLAPDSTEAVPDTLPFYPRNLGLEPNR